MRLSAQAKAEMIELSRAAEFKALEKKIFAEHPGTIQATNQFTDFIQFIHRMADHPLREVRPMKGDFKL